MQISIVNHTGGSVTDEELHRVIRAINRQIAEDFAPFWGMSASLRLEGRSTDRPDTIQIPDLRGDAVIYLWNESDIDGALGYHDKNAKGIPFGFVFTQISQQIGEPWSVTLSHEALELIADPETNLLVMGPHPSDNRDVFHWFEMCDAVQNETYSIDEIEVSNFVLPLYFTGTRDTDEVGARNDFLGRMSAGQTLKSFGINPGGYIGFFDPETNGHQTFTLRGDEVAMMRMKQKSRAKETRRAVRYRSFKQRDHLRLAGLESTSIRGKKSAVAASSVAAGNQAFMPSGERIYCNILDASGSATGTKKKLTTRTRKTSRAARKSAKPKAAKKKTPRPR